MWGLIHDILNNESLSIAQRKPVPMWFNVLKRTDWSMSFSPNGQQIEFLEVEYALHRILTDVWPVVNGIICPFLNFSDLASSTSPEPQARPIRRKL